MLRTATGLSEGHEIRAGGDRPSRAEYSCVDQATAGIILLAGSVPHAAAGAPHHSCARNGLRAAAQKVPVIHCGFSKAAESSRFRASSREVIEAAFCASWATPPPALRCRSAILSVGLAPSHHLLTVSIERVVDDRLCCDHFVIVFEAKVPKAFGDRVKPRGLRLIPQRVVRVGAVYDLCQKNDGWITREPMFLHKRIERALLAVVSVLDALDVIGRRSFALRHVHHLLGWHEQELRLRVDEFADQPRAGDPVNLHVLTCHPFHVHPPSALCDNCHFLEPAERL